MKVLGLLFAAAMMLVAAPAGAVVLSVVGGSADTIPGNFNPSGFPGGASIGDPITVFNSGDAGGLSLSGNGSLKFEYFGSEAGFTNFFAAGGLFSNAVSAVGDSFVTPVAGGFVPFSFITTGGGGLSASNNGPIDAGLSLAFANIGGGSFLILFNDGGGADFDRDDMVVKVSVSQVPLPAAVWLLLSAVLGLMSFSRIRGKSIQTA